MGTVTSWYRDTQFIDIIDRSSRFIVEISNDKSALSVASLRNSPTIKDKKDSHQVIYADLSNVTALTNPSNLENPTKKDVERIIKVLERVKSNLLHSEYVKVTKARLPFLLLGMAEKVTKTDPETIKHRPEMAALQKNIDDLKEIALVLLISDVGKKVQPSKHGFDEEHKQSATGNRQIISV